MGKTLRVRSRTGWDTKPVADLPGNRLTAQEVDDNFLAMEDQGLPSGGSTGTYLQKLSTTDFDVTWAASVGGNGEVYVQASNPVSPGEGAIWYNTTSENFLIYREVSPAVFNWIPLVFGTDNSDTIDGGYY